ncbi:MAG: cupin domain-containing protein [Sedimenticola sp.]|nr:cupin domain-containing protein [Sedimenticola sp.]
MKTRRDEIKCYQTKDGSLIRELMHPLSHGAKNQSLAEAVVPAGVTTHLHRHLKSEELYHITQGTGEMQWGETKFRVAPGDTVLIPPGTPHAITNTGNEDLVLLCCCAPAYSHEDTDLI